MFYYSEYKQLQEIVLVGVKAALAESEKSGVLPEVSIIGSIMHKALETLEWGDRLADLSSVKGFLGFMLMVDRFPAKFSADKAFWVEIHVVGSQMLELFKVNQEPGMVEMWNADPDVIMSRRFIENPSLVIK